MDTAAAAGRAAAGEWDDAQVTQFLACDDFLMSMDNDTLQDLVLVPEPAAAETDQPSQPPSKRARHPQPANEFAALMQRMGADEDSEPGNASSSGECKEEPAGGGIADPVQKTKTKPLGPQAAQKKACREKARREKLNEGFVELARLIDPGMSKNDKTSIVADAIRSITQLRAENNQLRQLNKFLQEKVTEFEQQRAQAMLHAGPQYIMPGYAVPAGMQPMPMAMAMPTGDDKPAMWVAAPGQASTSSLPVAPASWLPPSTLDCSQDHKLRPPAA